MSLFPRITFKGKSSTPIKADKDQLLKVLNALYENGSELYEELRKSILELNVSGIEEFKKLPNRRTAPAVPISDIDSRMLENARRRIGSKCYIKYLFGSDVYVESILVGIGNQFPLTLNNNDPKRIMSASVYSNFEQVLNTNIAGRIQGCLPLKDIAFDLDPDAVLVANYADHLMYLDQALGRMTPSELNSHRKGLRSGLTMSGG